MADSLVACGWKEVPLRRHLRPHDSSRTCHLHLPHLHHLHNLPIPLCLLPPPPPHLLLPPLPSYLAYRYPMR